MTYYINEIDYPFIMALIGIVVILVGALVLA